MGDALTALRELGQSPWLDFITRDLLRSGRLAEMVRDGHVTGLTSNPAPESRRPRSSTRS
jgi:transaldolase